MGELIQFPVRHTENYQPLLLAIERMDSKTELTKMLYTLQQDGEARSKNRLRRCTEAGC